VAKFNFKSKFSAPSLGFGTLALQVTVKAKTQTKLHLQRKIVRVVGFSIMHGMRGGWGYNGCDAITELLVS